MGVYVTDELIAKAEKNGVSERLLKIRIRNGWDEERASSEARINRNDRYHNSARYRRYRQLAESNGVSYTTFKRRVDRGWTYEKAAKVPVLAKGDKLHPRKGWLALAAKNGISLHTYNARVYKYGWSNRKAATKPPQGKNKIEKD